MLTVIFHVLVELSAIENLLVQASSHEVCAILISFLHFEAAVTRRPLEKPK